MLPAQLLVPEVEEHLGARTCRFWREEGRRGTNRKKAELRKEGRERLSWDS